MAIAGHVSRRMLERYSNVRMEAKRNAIGLGFVGLIMAVALVVRVFGMLTDGTVQESMGLVRAEAIMLVVFIVGVFIERGRRNQLKQAA
jgi:hypothetical protein